MRIFGRFLVISGASGATRLHHHLPFSQLFFEKLAARPANYAHGTLIPVNCFCCF